MWVLEQETSHSFIGYYFKIENWDGTPAFMNCIFEDVDSMCQ